MKDKRKSWINWGRDESGKNWLCAGSVNDPKFTDDIAATYVIFHKGKAVYVGSTRKLRGRLVTHRSALRSRGMFDATIKYRPSRKFGDWAMVEIRLINRLRPILNYEHNEKFFGGGRCLTAS